MISNPIRPNARLPVIRCRVTATNQREALFITQHMPLDIDDAERLVADSENHQVGDFRQRRKPPHPVSNVKGRIGG